MAVSASRFLTKRRGDFIEYTAGMLSDPELFSDAEAFAGSFRDVRLVRSLKNHFRKVHSLGIRQERVRLIRKLPSAKA